MSLKSTGYVRAFGTSVTSTSYALSESRGASKPAGFIAIGDNPEGDKFRGLDGMVIGTGADNATGEVTLYLVFAVLSGLTGQIESYHWRTLCSFDVTLSAAVGLGTATGSAILTTERIADTMATLSVSSFASSLITSFGGKDPTVNNGSDTEALIQVPDTCNAYGLAVDLKCGTATSLNFVFRRNV